MKRWWKYAAPAFLGLLLLLALGTLMRAREPSWEGRGLRQWLLKLTSLETVEREAARLALDHMGEEALPGIRRALLRRDTVFKQLLTRHFNPTWTTGEQWRRAGLEAVALLQSRALPLLPEVIQVLTNEALHIPGLEVEGALMGMGPEAVPDLTRLLREGGLLPGHEVLLQKVAGRLIDPGMTSNEVLSPLVAECRRRLGPAFVESRSVEPWMRTLALILKQAGPAAEPAIPELLVLLRDKQEHVREASATTLGVIQARPALVVPALVNLLEDPASSVRSSAAEALGRFGASASPAVPVLARLVGEDVGSVGIACLNALGRMGSSARPATTEILQALAAESALMRATAAIALGRIEPIPDQVLPGLSAALEDEDLTVRLFAAQSLGRLRSAAAPAVPALMRALEANREAVQISVVQALGHIGPAAAPALPLMRLAWDNNQSALGPSVQEAMALIRKQETQ